ncbi:MAG: hypothetical protein GXO22_04345 [Aquificae bacterium]|nr:hypothetical protein [Aquificota bacterium]
MAFLGDIGRFVEHIGKEIIEAPGDIANFVGHTFAEMKDAPKDVAKFVSNIGEEVGEFGEKVLPEIARAYGEGIGTGRTQTAPIQAQSLPKTQQPKQRQTIDLNQEFMYQILVAVGVSIIVALILRD